MRWPFGPPHLTLKPSQKKHKNKKNKQKNKKEKTKKKEKKEAQTTNSKKPKNSLIAFQLSVKFFLFFWMAFQNFRFFTPWPKKPEHKKQYKNRGFGPFFLKSCCASRNGHFWTKKTKIYKFKLSFFWPIFFSFNNKKPHIC